MHGERTNENLSFLQHPHTTAFGGPEHGLYPGHFGSCCGHLLTIHGSQIPATALHSELLNTVTLTSAQPSTTEKGNPGIDMVFQELRAISSCLSQVEHRAIPGHQEMEQVHRGNTVGIYDSHVTDRKQVKVGGGGGQ